MNMVYNNSFDVFEVVIAFLSFIRGGAFSERGRFGPERPKFGGHFQERRGNYTGYQNQGQFYLGLSLLIYSYQVVKEIWCISKYVILHYAL